MDNFIFKDISSTSFKIIVNSLPPISKPTMRVEETEVDGVDGTMFEDLGYESYDKKIKITITENNIDELIHWLKGEGQLVLSNEPDKYYKAKVIEQIDFERLIKYEPVEVAFRVQPYKYELYELPITLNTSGGTVFNNGLETSKPKMTITGSGNITLSVNNNLVFSYTFPEGETQVVVDSEKQDAYLGTVLKNRNMTGEFPILQSGSNIISWSGTITSIVVEPNSRWL